MQRRYDTQSGVTAASCAGLAFVRFGSSKS